VSQNCVAKTSPPYVSVQHESVTFGCASAEHERYGVADGSQKNFLEIW
jgi:hypothetical protein